MLSDADPQALRDAIVAGREERGTREIFWRKWIEAAHGRNWRGGSGRKSQVNYAHVFKSTFLPALAFRTPKVKLRPTLRGGNEVAAEVYQNAINNWARSQGVLKEVRRCILDAFYAFGIMKTGLMGSDYMLAGDVSSEPGNVSLDLSPHTPLLPYATRVSPFDFLWDDTSKRFSSAQFLAHEFERNVDLLIDDERYDLQAYDAENLAFIDQEHGAHRYRDGTKKKMPKVAKITEVFLRDMRRIVTLIETGKNEFIIARSVPYWGPDNGPYRMLSFLDTEDSMIPMSPGAGQWDQLVDLEEQQYLLANEIKAEKRIVAFKGGTKKSAQIAQEAKHDHMVTGMDDTGTQVVYGGATKERTEGVNILNQNYQFSSALSDVVRGNITGSTATEASLANQNSNIRLDDMRLQVQGFASEFYSDVFWYAFNDENVLLKSGIQIPGSGSTLNLLVQGGPDIDPATGQPTTNFDTTDFLIEIDAQSMYRIDGPLERAQAIEEGTFFMTVIAPAAMMSGYMVDIVEFTRDFGERTGRPGLENLLVPMTPEAQMLFMQQQMASMATPGAGQGAMASDGQKMPLGGKPGGAPGQMMQGQATAQANAGAASAPTGQANKPVKSKNQHSAPAPKQQTGK